MQINKRNSQNSSLDVVGELIFMVSKFGLFMQQPCKKHSGFVYGTGKWQSLTLGDPKKFCGIFNGTLALQTGARKKNEEGKNYNLSSKLIMLDGQRRPGGVARHFNGLPFAFCAIYSTSLRWLLSGFWILESLFFISPFRGFLF